MRKLPVFLLIPLLALLPAGCATVAAPPMLVQPAHSAGIADLPFHGKSILIIPPQIIYRDTYKEKELLPGQKSSLQPMAPLWASMSGSAPTQEGRETISALAIKYAHQTTAQRGFDTRAAEDLPPGSVQESALELVEESGNLIKAWSDNRENLLNRLKTIKKTTGIDGIIVQKLDVKVGVPSQWDAVATGRISAGTSSSDFRTALVETSSGDVVWERESFFRDLPDTAVLERMLTMLFQEFPRKLEE